MSCKIDRKQLKLGVEIEMEHTTSKKKAEKIAMDHLKEFCGKPYYTELIKMEKKLQK